jgi:hypothetical protein
VEQVDRVTTVGTVRFGRRGKEIESESPLQSYTFQTSKLFLSFIRGGEESQKRMRKDTSLSRNELERRTVLSDKDGGEE